MTNGSMLGIFTRLKAKTSLYSVKRLTSTCYVCSVISLPTRTMQFGRSLSKSTILRSLVVSGRRCSGSAEAMVQITMASVATDDATRGFLGEHATRPALGRPVLHQGFCANNITFLSYSLVPEDFLDVTIISLILDLQEVRGNDVFKLL